MGSSSGVALGLVRAMRPRQWIKNLLVFAAPLAAGVMLQQEVLRASVLALMSFTAASSATYLVNDVLDVKADRLHPDKRHRAIASGVVPVPTAITIAGLLAIVSVGAPVLLGFAPLAAATGSYLIVQAVYFTWAKDQPVFDLAAVSAGFVLRAVAGGVAAGLYISPWFLTVTASVSMFVIAGKRYSELVSHGDSGTRKSLSQYSPGYLRFVWSVSVAVAAAFYALWAADIVARGGGMAAQLSTVPFCLILLRYARDVDSGRAEAPERIVLGDRALLVLGLIWAGLFFVEVLGN